MEWVGKKYMTKNKITKKEDKKEIVPYTDEQTKKFIMSASFEYVPKTILKELGEMIPKFLDSDKKERDKMLDKINDKTMKAMRVYGFETHVPLAESVPEGVRTVAIELSNQLQKEYNCQTPSEFALVEIVANSYARILDYSRAFNSCQKIEYLSSEKNGYYTMISKEIDKANRQFISALTTLKHIKSPGFDITVKAKTAFVSQNQQINSNKDNKDEKIIDSK